MSSSHQARYGALTALTVFAAAVLCLLSLGSANASAADVTNGTAQFTIGVGKGGKVLISNGVKVSKVAPAKVSRKGKRSVAKLPVSSLKTGARSDATLRGGFVLRKGKRAVRINLLNLAVLKSGKVGVGGKIQLLGGKKSGAKPINIFDVAGKAKVSKNGDKTTLKIKQGKVSFTNAVVRTVRNHLRLNKLPSAQIAALNVNATRTADKPVDPCVANPDAQGCPIVDPYLAQCNVAATSKVPGNLPGATALPVLSGAKATVAPQAIDWGFRSDFRSYVIFGASGSLKAANGASTVGGPPIISAFSFPASGGQYAINSAMDNTDDQLVLNGTGTALFCATGHEFRVAISNPTLVIDGANSRIIADVDANLTGAWIPTQRVDLAKLDLDGITPAYNKSGSEVTWGNVPASLTDAGAKSICGVGANTACSYVEGTTLDPINVSIATAYDTGAGDAAAWDALASYVETNLPFPNPTAANGGCEVGVPAGGSTINARTIDEHVALGGTSSVWTATPNRPVSTPVLSGTAVTSGNFNWGFRSSLRSSLNATGQFNLADGATASNPGAMGGPGKFFTWPVVNGTYDPNGAGDADDKLVLRTQGVVAFCQTQAMQRYGIIFANPTVVIDGPESRITIDVMTRYRLSWVRSTVDFASLNLADATFASTTDSGIVTKTWSFPDAAGTPAIGPVTLTADGEKMARLLSPGTYVAGLGLDGATIRASFPE